MLELDYNVDLASIQKAREVDLAAATIYELRYSLFVGDVRITDSQAGVDLSALWGWVPVIDFALGLKYVADVLETEKVGQFDFTESEAALNFCRVGDSVEISATYAPGLINVPVETFRYDVETFALRMVNDLCTRNIRLAANPEIRRQFGLP